MSRRQQLIERGWKLVATIQMPTLADGHKAWRCDADPEHINKMMALRRQYPNAEVIGNIHEGFEFWSAS